MQKKRLWLSLLIAVAACGAAAVASAAGFSAGGAEPGPRTADAAPAVAADVAGAWAVGAAAFAGGMRSQAAETPRLPQPRAQQSRSERRSAANERPRADAPRRNRNRGRNTNPAPAAAVNTAPRLQLDAAEAPLSEEALAIERAIEVVAHAASAARQAASAASAAQGRIQTLERTVGELRNETQSQRERLARQDNSRMWVWLLAAAVLLLVGLALWLARRLSKIQHEYEQRWLAVGATRAALPPAAAPGRAAAASIPFVTAEPRRLPAHKKPPLSPPWPAPAPVQPWEEPAQQATQPMAAPTPPRQFIPDTAMQRTEPLPPSVRSATEEAPSSPRDVSIEELIDLEQQAEFFVVLGQDDAAIDLLSEHLRNTGGGSPLPYLKLLEIYRRRGDLTDYERIRKRFNHRFNAYAPEWGSDLGAGRSLEDYAGILPRLQQVWSRPLDAMAEMEALLFRKSRGDLFDLPAYRELLFLYSLARDLLDREAADTGTVDLLLPLSNADERGGEFGPTAPTPFLGLEPEGGRARGDSEERPTLPLDFDLTVEGQRQASIFDPLDQHGKPPKAR